MRVAEVLVFLAAVTVLAELADAAGVFEVAAVRAARAARGRTAVLFAVLFALAAATTVLLSLDTTAVLLTPVVLSVARRLGLNPWPFALATVWTANTASLLLPVSNLTNLLAADRLGLAPSAYAGRTAPAAAAALAVTAAVLVAWQWRHLRGTYPVPPPYVPGDRPFYLGAALACALLLPALLVGVPAHLAAPGSALVAVLAAALRRPSALSPRLVPWRMIAGVTVLFALVEVLGPRGLDSALQQHGTGSDLHVAFAAAFGANVANNLPAYVALERVVPSGQTLPLLLGVNLGPLVAPWGSLATLLWADRCRARGVRVSWPAFGGAGLVLVPLLLLATVPLI